MRKILALGGLILTMSGGSAFAQNTTFEVTGSAPQVCVMQTPVLSQTTAAVNVRTLSGSSLQIDQLVDPATLATRAASAQVSFAAVCTFPHRVSLQSGSNGLWRTQASGVTLPNGFADAVPYTAVLKWGSNTDSLSADARSRGTVEQTVPIAEATTGALTVDLSIQAGASNQAANSPLLAGVYSDTLTITLEPQ